MTEFRPGTEGETEEIHACRRLLATRALAPSALVTVTTLRAELDHGLWLTVLYVADRLVLNRDGFIAYAKARTTAMPYDTPLESLAALVADDLANELVPKWLRVMFTQTVDGAPSHDVMVEDRQPGWDHPVLKSL